MSLYASRVFIPLIIFLTIIGSANAADDAAKKFIEKVSHDALEVITSGSSADDKESKLSKLFISSVDTKWIAHFAMGKYWKEATEDQRKEYVDVHRKFLLNSYIPKFKEYNNQDIKILKSYASEKNSNEFTVETQIVPKDGSAISVNYKVRKDGGKFMIYDVVAEGVSLIATERSDFTSVLGRGGIDELIRMLGKKI